MVENEDGAISTIGSEAIGVARLVADDLGAEVTGLVFGADVGGVAAEAFDLGCNTVIGVDDDDVKRRPCGGHWSTGGRVGAGARAGRVVGRGIDTRPVI